MPGEATLSAPVRHVLFLCTGNSARSILAEAALARHGGERWRAHSAGSHPTGRVHPLTLRTLERHGHDVAGLASKGFDAFAGPGAPELDLVVTVCSAAAGEACPVWPGAPLRAHWGVEDPAAFDGPEAEAAAGFERAYAILEHRVKALVALPFEALEPPARQRALDEIGQSSP